MREDLIERLRERAQFEDKRVLDEAKAMGFEPEVYTGSQTGALLREAAAALEAAREEVKAVGTVLGGEFHYLRPSHGLPDGTMLYAIDQARGKGGGEVEGG